MKKHLPFFLIAAIALLLDQISKYMIEAVMDLGESIQVIPGFFQLLYVRNTGAAWSLFAGSSMIFFYIVTVVAVVVLFLFYRSCETKDHWNKAALALIMAGALGNFIDRLCFQYVRPVSVRKNRRRTRSENLGYTTCLCLSVPYSAPNSTRAGIVRKGTCPT